MWIGLLDENKKPYHPSVVERVDCDLIEWKLDYWKDGWLRLTNRTMIKMRVHFTIGRPTFYAFFKDIDSDRSFYASIRFADGEDRYGVAFDRKTEQDVGTITAINAGDYFAMHPGYVCMNLPGPADPKWKP